MFLTIAGREHPKPHRLDQQASERESESRWNPGPYGFHLTLRTLSDAVRTARRTLQQGSSPPLTTNFTLDQTRTLLDLYPCSNYFKYSDGLCRQKHGCARRHCSLHSRQRHWRCSYLHSHSPGTGFTMWLSQNPWSGGFHQTHKLRRPIWPVHYGRHHWGWEETTRHYSAWAIFESHHSLEHKLGNIKTVPHWWENSLCKAEERRPAFEKYPDSP